MQQILQGSVAIRPYVVQRCACVDFKWISHLCW